MEVVDFASDIHAKREHDRTCSFPETHKCEVHHLTFNSKFLPIDRDYQKLHPKSYQLLRKRGVERVLRPENIVVFCFSKAKASAAYNQQATTNIISIMKTGKLPVGSKCEAFYCGKRIEGGDRTGFPPLPDKLNEWTDMEPLYSDLRRWRRSRDGCAAQYQGKGAFLGWQTMKARHSIECEDRRKITMHGKDVADGDGSAVSGMVRNSFKDDYGSGSQNLVRHLAHKHPTPKSERRTRYFGQKGYYATTQYIYMFIPEDGIDLVLVAADAGYGQSSKDHYYRSMGATIEASRLLRRERACGCQPCLKFHPHCILTPANTMISTG